MRPIFAVLVAYTTVVTCADASDFPKEEVDKAIAVVTAREKESIEACVVATGTKIA